MIRPKKYCTAVIYAAVTYCTEQGLKFEWNILRIGYKEIKELPL
jgi:hypothetical protein